MKVAIIGSSDFGKAVLDAFLDRGDEVVIVCCPPDNPKSNKPDAIKLGALERGITPLQLPSLKGPELIDIMRNSGAEIIVMAYVLQFVPQELVNSTKYGTIQYHPSLLPKYRGPSAINWAIALGETETGLTIFRPSDGMDEGAVILQKTVPIGPDDTLGEVYFNRLFPIGVSAMLEATDLVVQSKHTEIIQDESLANYEGWFNPSIAKINWFSHINATYNLIRACNPAPGASAMYKGQKVQIYDCRKHISPTFKSVKGQPGQITDIQSDSVFVACPGGQIEIIKAKSATGKKDSAANVAAELAMVIGDNFDI
jgi:methionyl-tRNA formyltransferase